MLSFALGLLITSISYAQCNSNSSSHHVKKASWSHSADLVDIAVDNKDFSTLVTAVKAADLVNTLKGEGPFTIFAPTNDAFAKVDEETLESLLEPRNKKQLTSILTYHVISGEFLLSDIKAALKEAGATIELTTVNGDRLRVRQGTDGIYLKDEKGNYSKITATDIKGSNGVIHVIDTVIMPS